MNKSWSFLGQGQTQNKAMVRRRFPWRLWPMCHFDGCGCILWCLLRISWPVFPARWPLLPLVTATFRVKVRQWLKWQS